VRESVRVHVSVRGGVAGAHVRAQNTGTGIGTCTPARTNSAIGAPVLFHVMYNTIASKRAGCQHYLCSTLGDLRFKTSQGLCQRLCHATLSTGLSRSVCKLPSHVIHLGLVRVGQGRRCCFRLGCRASAPRHVSPLVQTQQDHPHHHQQQEQCVRVGMEGNELCQCTSNSSRVCAVPPCRVKTHRCTGHIRTWGGFRTSLSKQRKLRAWCQLAMPCWHQGVQRKLSPCKPPSAQ
jgi:hypothetical protein